MRKFLYFTMDLIARAHNWLLSLNDAYEYNFSDKQLHFLVIGLFGMMVLAVVHPLFLHLAKKGHVLVVSWIYVFTLILGLTLAIEIGQKISHTGSMEFSDIVFGIVGFLAMFSAYVLVRGAVQLAVWLVRRKKAKCIESEDKH